MEGISRRELARRFGVSESTVRRHIDSGALADALRRDGSLDPTIALSVLAQVVVAGRGAPSAVTVAKDRRLRAQIARLADEVAELHSGSISQQDAENELDAQRKFIHRHMLSAITDGCSAAGRRSDKAAAILQDAIHSCPERVSADDDGPEDGDEAADAPFVDNLQRLPQAALVATRIDLQAQKLELEHGRERGELLAVVDVVAQFEARLATVKSLLVAIPSRLASHAVTATTEEFRTFLDHEVRGALAEL